MKELKEIWSKHKPLIILGAVIIVGVTIYNNSQKSAVTVASTPTPPPTPPMTPTA